MTRLLFSALVLGLVFASASTNASAEPSEEDIRAVVQKDKDSMTAMFSTFTPLLTMFCGQQAAPPFGPDGKKPLTDRPNPFGKGFQEACNFFKATTDADFRITKVGCVPATGRLGYHCDYLLELAPASAEKSALFASFFDTAYVFSSRFVRFRDRWHIARETAPFTGQDMFGANR